VIGRPGQPDERAGGAETPGSDAATVPGRPGAQRDIALDRTITRTTDAGPAEPPADAEPSTVHADPAAPLAPEELPPMAAEQYVLGPEVARGGMGRVIRAIDRRLGRVVALKQLSDDSPRRRLRFAREAQITARLQHPAIVPVYEVGPWPGGGMAYAMKLVSGRPLAAVIHQTGTLAERLALLPRLIEVVDAVAYAHSQRVIHRDIKPSNIILGDFGESILIDWGVAKLLDGAAPVTGDALTDPADEPDLTGDLEPPDMPSGDLTQPGAVVGTPAYMAPEQAGGEPLDERADVYALGTMLYHLLTGRLPYRGAGTQIVAQVIAGPPPPLEEVEPHVPAELAAVVARAMDRERERRYSAAELAAELRRFTTGQLVAGYRYSARERLARWIGRHRAAVAVAAAALLLLAAGAVVSAIRIVRERDQAEAARAEAIRRVDELTVEKAIVELGRDAPGALRLLDGLSRGSPMWRGARVVASGADDIGVSRVIGHERETVDWFRTLEGGSLLVGSERFLAVWNPATGARRTLEADQVLALSFRARHALVRRRDQLVIIALPAGTGVPLGKVPPGLSLGAVSDDGKLAAVADAGGTRLWPLGGQARHLGPAPTGRVLAFSPTGDYLLTYTDVDLEDDRGVPDGVAPGAGAWSLPDGAWTVISRFDFVDGSYLVQSADGERIGTRSREGHLYILGARDRSFSTYSLPGFGHKMSLVSVAAFSPDSKLYAMGDTDYHVRLIGRDTPTQIVTKRDGEVTAIDWLPDSRGVLAASRDATVTLFKMARPYYSTFAFPRPVVRMAVTPDGKGVAVLLDDGAIRTLRLPIDDEVQWPQPIARAALAGDGTVALVPQVDPSEVRVAHPAQEPRALGRCDQPIAALAAAPGAVAALCGGTVWLWPDQGAAVAVPTRIGETVGAIAMSRAGDLFSWSKDGVLRRRSASGAEKTVAVALPAGSLLAVTPDGARAVLASGTDLVWVDLATGAAERRPAGRDPLLGLALSPDGSLAAVGGSDNLVVLHPRAGGAARPLARRHALPATVLAFSADGSLLLSGSVNSTIQYWDVPTGVTRMLAGHWTPILALGFDPDGAVRTISERLSRRIRDDLPRGEAGLRAWIASALSEPTAATAPPPAPAR
jgi:eukaryotic-like serine/threonine-protein kinase